MKGIILAGGKGTRLYPSTYVTCKQLLPIYDKPMIFYPLSVLMLSGIRDILIITNPEDKKMFVNLLGDGSRFGCSFQYEVQESPNGIAEAFIIGEQFINNSSVALILGDNLFYGSGLGKILRKGNNQKGATVFAIEVESPERYGVIEIDSQNKPISIEEKPKNPRSNLALTGLYFYDNNVVEISKSINPSSRGEKEITAVNNVYLAQNNISVEVLPRGMTWIDAGTPDSIYKAGEFVKIIEERTSRKVACLEEVAYNLGFIDQKEIIQSIDRYGDSDYSKYLEKIVKK
jgi:glucose-1-phosphate thymidylyltransferase